MRKIVTAMTCICVLYIISISAKIVTKWQLSRYLSLQMFLTIVVDRDWYFNEPICLLIWNVRVHSFGGYVLRRNYCKREKWWRLFATAKRSLKVVEECMLTLIIWDICLDCDTTWSLVPCWLPSSHYFPRQVAYRYLMRKNLIERGIWNMSVFIWELLKLRIWKKICATFL